MYKDYNFWFAPPSSILSNHDIWLGYGFAAIFGLGIICWLSAFMVKQPVIKKALNKLKNVLFATGLVGLVWFGFRYEATPIFAKRIWAAAIALGGLVWFGFVGKYLLFQFVREKAEYDNEMLRSKYLPKKKN